MTYLHTSLWPSPNCRALHSCIAPLPRDAVEWVCSGECVLFQWHADWVIYGLLSARQRLLLGKSRRGATTSLFSPDPMMSGLSAPSLKLAACHPSCWGASQRNPIGCEPQLDLDWAAVSATLICIKPEEGNIASLTLCFLPFYCLHSCHSISTITSVRIGFFAIMLFSFTLLNMCNDYSS